MKRLETQSMPKGLQIVAVLLLVLFFTRFGGLFSLPPTDISAFWPANALLFCGVFLISGKPARMTLLLAIPSYFLAEVWIGYPLLNATAYSIANVAEVSVLLWLLHKVGIHRLVFDNFKNLFQFLALSLLASPVGGAIGAIVATHAGAEFESVLMRWSLADFFGYCLFAPLLLSWSTWKEFFTLKRRGRVVELAALLVTLLSISMLSYGALGFIVPPGAQFLPMPVLLWAALRFGPPGGALAMALVASIAFFSATHGVGLFSIGSPEENVASLQIFFATLVVSVMAIASLNAERKKSFETLRQEIAERRETEEALLQSEARYRRILTTANEGIVVTDADRKITFVNTRLAQILGENAESLLGRTMTEFMFEEDLPDHYEMLKHRSHGLAENYERRFRLRDGKIVWAHVSATPIMDDTGHFAGTFAMFTDITERKRTEEELLLVRFALNNMREAAFLIDENACFHFVNEGACRALGYSREELLGLHVADVDPDFPADRWQEHWRELKAKRSLLFEGRHQTKRGRSFPVEISANYFQFGPQHFNLALVRDITERKQAEEEVRRSRDRLEEAVQQRTAELLLARDAAQAANTAKSVFLANMSHELRTPLNAILGFSRLMRQDPDLKQAQYQNLDIINHNGEHLLKLINDVLEIAKIEAGKLQLDVTSFDLHIMVRDAIDMMRLRAQQKGLYLKLDQSSEFPRYIKGDEARMRQILLNLVSNAVKFTHQGGVSVRLGTKQNLQQHLVIEVEDSGPGICESDQQRLFKPFTQLAEGTEQGTGLGLSIVRQFVQLMSGKISVESAPDKGSLFRVELPLAKAEEAEISQPESEHKGEVVGLAPGQPNHRILIAEDQPDNRRLLVRLMTDLGFEVKAADNGEACVRIFKAWRPDLIWMDWRMPVMDGLEATRQIRRLDDGDKVKIIAVTASAFKEQQDELRAVGTDDCISKPFRINEIYEGLARQLGVEFVYRPTVPVTESMLDALTPEHLRRLSSELRDELHTALLSLDPQRINTAIVRIGDVDEELGRLLEYMTNRFNYPGILGVLDKVVRE